MNINRSILISVMVLTLAACGGAEERKTRYMEKALESYAERDYDKARIEIKNVLQIDPKHAEAWFIQAKIMEKKGELRKAYGNYAKAAELDPENTQYLGKLGQFLLVLANDLDGATENMNKIKEIDRSDNYGLLLEAGIAARNDDKARAIELTERVHSREPGLLDNALFLSSLKTDDNDLEGALKVLEEATPDNPDEPALMKRIAGLLLSLERNDESEKVLNEVLALDPDDYDNYLNLARFYVKLQRFDDGKKILASAIENDPEDLERHREYLALIQASDGLLAAIDALKAQIRKDDLDGQLMLVLANLHSQDNDTDSTKRVLVSTIDKYNLEQSGVRARIGLAELAVNERELDEARGHIAEAYEISPNDADVNMMRARLMLNAGKMDEGIVSLRSVIKDEPTKLDAYLLLARAHDNGGEPEQAKDVLARAHENNRGVAPNLLALSKLYIERKDFVSAEKVIDDYLKINNVDYDALSIKVAALNSRKDYAEAEKVAEKLKTLYPDKPNGYLQLVPVYMDADKFDEAIAMLDDGITQTNNDMKIMAIYGRMVLSKEGESAVEPLIARITETLGEGDSIDSYMLLAKIYEDNGRSEDSRRILDRGLAKHRKQTDAYLMRANYYEKDGDQAGVLRILETGLRFVPEKSQIGIALARLHQNNGDNDKVLDVYREVTDSGTANVIVLNNLAALLVEGEPTQAEIDEAVKVVDRLREIDNHAVRDTVAWVKYLSGDVQGAEKILAKLVDEHREFGEYHYHYGVVMNELGDTEKAIRHLKRAVNSENSYAGKDKAAALLEELTSS